MAFYLTSAVRRGDGEWLLGDLSKVRLAGSSGPLARHISNLPADSTGEWNLEAEEIAAAFPCDAFPEGATPFLLWDSGDSDGCPMRVIRICGISREFDTELLVHMEILEERGETMRPTGRHTSEALRLLGGRVTPNAKWLWAAPKMSIGSTIVSPGLK
jgi:hypothetical protein